MFQFRNKFLFSFLVRPSSTAETEIINTAYLRKKELSLLNSMLFTMKDKPNYNEICTMIREVLPSVQSITKFTDLKDYSRISYKLDLKKDKEIIEQLLTLILQDQLGNFIIKDKLIQHIIESVKLKTLDDKIIQLMSQLDLKSSEIQKKYIQKYVKAIEKRIVGQSMFSQITNISSNWEDSYQKLIKAKQTKENKLKLLTFLIESSVKQHQQHIQEHFPHPTIQEISMLLPYHNELEKNYLETIIHEIIQYISAAKIDVQTLGQINQLISRAPEIFKSNKFNFDPLLKQLDIPNLLETQINQLLYIILNTRSLPYFRSNEQKIIDYITTKQGINVSQMVAIFSHLTLIYRESSNFSDELLSFCCDFLSNNLSKCDANQLFLIVKALRLVQQNVHSKALQLKIDNKIEEGAFEQNPDALINYVGNKIKATQVLFMPETALKAQVTQKNFGDWCYLISQIGSIRDLEQAVIEKFKQIHLNLRQSLKQNQYFYYFTAQFLCEIHDEQFFLKHQQHALPFTQIRILHFIGQSQSSQYQQLINDIKESILRKENYLFQNFRRLDLGLLSFSLFTASLFDDQSFYNILSLKYQKEISQLVLEFNQNQSYKREKQFKSSVNQTTNQTLVQFYQALMNHYCLTNETSPYLTTLENTVRQYSKTEQTMPSQLEEKVESILVQNKIEYIKDYSEILPYRLDFYIPSKSVGIECNGCSHYIAGVLRKSDALKYNVFKLKGIDVKIVKYHSVNYEQIVEQYLKC